MNKSNINLECYMDLKSITEKYPQFTKNQLRWLIACKDEKGINHIIKRVGRRIYFNIPSFLEWIEKQNA